MSDERCDKPVGARASKHPVKEKPIGSTSFGSCNHTHTNFINSGVFLKPLIYLY